MRCNLHTHSTYSDGVLTPRELVKRQKADGTEVMALTDHDSVSGIDEAIAAGEEYGVKILPGIELSCYGTFEIHILGYNFDYKNAEFCRELEKIKELRRTRTRLTIAKLAELNMPLEESAFNFEDCNLGRMHIAKEMIKEGYVRSVNDAFNRYLGSGKPAHVAGYRLRPFEGVGIIKKFGGTAVLAHPLLYPADKRDAIVAGLKAYGLDGLECYYSSHNPADTAAFLKIAERYGLIATCGTDYHNDDTYLSPFYRCDKMDARALKMLKIK